MLPQDMFHLHTGAKQHLAAGAHRAVVNVPSNLCITHSAGAQATVSEYGLSAIRSSDPNERPVPRRGGYMMGGGCQMGTSAVTTGRGRQLIFSIIGHHRNSRRSFRASSSIIRTCRCSLIVSLANSPCFRAFRFPLGAPVLSAPPCMRQRALPCAAGARQASPSRVRAPQRGLARIGTVLRVWPPVMGWRLALPRAGSPPQQARSHAA